jgi:GTPase
MTEKNKKRAGYIAISGKPNVGKSTLLNGILGKKVAITSGKPQTTRQRVLGIKTIESVQMLFVDTPGIHLQAGRELNRRMNKVAKAALHDVDLVMFVTDLTWDKQDEYVLEMLKTLSIPVILVVNKVDQIKDKMKLLPLLAERTEKMDFIASIPVSALKQKQIADVESQIVAVLPTSVHYFPPDQFTDRSDRFMASEMVREKLMRLLGQELPYRTAVSIELFEETKKILNIHVVIWVERKAHKAIVIGRGGDKLKRIGSEARVDMEAFFDKKVCLKSWVKVKSGWSDNTDFLDVIDIE